MPRSWNREKQIALEMPAEPLTATCPKHAPGRTVVVRDGTAHCLWCFGCFRCGARRFHEDRDDMDLYLHPVRLGSKVIRGNWQCWNCSETIVHWSRWRRDMLSWIRGHAARRGGYRRPEERKDAA